MEKCRRPDRRVDADQTRYHWLRRMIAIDNTFLSLLLRPDAKPPQDPATKRPVDHVPARIKYFLENLEVSAEIMIIPTPALSEFLLLADKAGPSYLSLISANRLFKIEGFDERAAIELAAMNLKLMRAARGTSKRAAKRQRADQEGTWAKISFDRQIVAIAKVKNADAIYSDDN